LEDLINTDVSSLHGVVPEAGDWLSAQITLVKRLFNQS
jgi:hypothetical protein